jgi:hypothetical protein
MADEVHHPHDSMVVAVLKDPAEAASFILRVHHQGDDHRD